MTQNSKAVNKDFGDCRYRGGSWEQDGPEVEDKEFVSDGKMCAIGCIISDKHYNPSLEDNNVTDSYVEAAVRESNPLWKWDEHTLELLQVMQYVHDDMEVEHWSDAFDLMDEQIEVTGLFPDQNSIRDIAIKVTGRSRSIESVIG
jgi:hypothetical protein